VQYVTHNVIFITLVIYQLFMTHIMYLIYEFFLRMNPTCGCFNPVKYGKRS